MSFYSGVAVVYPDYCGHATAAGFDRVLAEVLPGATSVTVVNSPDAAQVPPADVHPGTLVVRTPAGFNIAVLTGLVAAVEGGFEKVVRIDTAEHDPALAPPAARAPGEDRGRRRGR